MEVVLSWPNEGSGGGNNSVIFLGFPRSFYLSDIVPWFIACVWTRNSAKLSLRTSAVCPDRCAELLVLWHPSHLAACHAPKVILKLLINTITNISNLPAQCGGFAQRVPILLGSGTMSAILAPPPYQVSPPPRASSL